MRYRQVTAVLKELFIRLM